MMKISLLKNLGLFMICMSFLNSCKAQKTNQVNTPNIIVNKGVGGNSTNDLLKRIDTDVINENPDLVVLMIGTNDLLNSRKMISYEEYASNLDVIVKTIKENNIQVLLMSSPPVDSVYLFTRHDKKLFNEAPNVKINKARIIVEQVSKDNKTLYLNLQAKFIAKGLPKHNEDLYIRNVMNSNKKDGVHPTPLGYQFIAEQVFEYLKENNLTNKFGKIICFGDSITRGGQGAKRGETTSGKNYPSFLYKMLINSTK